jgi:hypothetical protein
MLLRLTALLLALTSTGIGAEAPVRLLVVTGGHDYPTSFYTLFEQDGLSRGAFSCFRALGFSISFSVFDRTSHPSLPRTFCNRTTR